ncbi:MAG: oligosaccharide flippase family protein [Clostridium sp.]|nr:oligosaccharide flippase family protein [Clostridium sp.]MDU7084668.1 oligosaccharide flippase family protein [Clostridium sp.]
MKKVNQLKAGVILSYISLGLASFVSLLYTPVMLRLLGQSEYGLYSLSLNIIGYLGILDFGLGNAVIRYTAKYRALDDREEEANLHGMFIVIYSILAIIIILAGGVLVLNCKMIFKRTLTVNELYRIRILMSILIFNLAISFPLGVFEGIISAYEHFIFPKILSIIRTIINPLIMLPLLFMGYQSVGMTIAMTIVNIIFSAINMYYCFRILNIKLKFNKFNFQVIREISGYSFFIFLNIIVEKIYWSTDQFILGAVSGTVAVAIYSVGSTINNYYINFSTAISGVFLPRITRMVTKNASDEEISKLFVKTGRIQYILMTFILSGFALFGQEFIYTWAGEGYGEAYYIALVVMIPLTIPLIQNVGITILQAKNIHQFRSKVYIVIAVLNVAASIPLAKAFGGVGAALASAGAMIIGNIIVINIFYYKKAKINIPYFWKNIFIMTLPVAISIIIGKFINVFINISGYLGIIIKGCIFSVIFFILMWSLGMNTYEKDMFRIPIIKIKNKVLFYRKGIRRFIQ